MQNIAFLRRNARCGTYEGGEGRVLIDQELEAWDQDRPVVSSGHVSLDDVSVSVALVVVLENEPLGSILEVELASEVHWSGVIVAFGADDLHGAHFKEPLFHVEAAFVLFARRCGDPAGCPCC